MQELKVSNQEVPELSRFWKAVSGILIVTVIVILALSFVPGMIEQAFNHGEYAMGERINQGIAFCWGKLDCIFP